MQAFEYVSPTTLQAAVQLLAEAKGEAAVLAGGTDLLSLMKDRIVSPGRVIDLQKLKELRRIEFQSGSGLRLGALVTLDELIENADVRQHYPALVQAAQGVSSPQIRSVGTVGGDLCQRPRCWYYRAGYGLLATYKGKPLVPDGDNRYHAILGNSGPAYFVSPSSLGPALLALGAKVRLHGPEGARELEVEKFFVTPASESESEHALKAHEILTEIVVPPADGIKMAVYEVRKKRHWTGPWLPPRLPSASRVMWSEGRASCSVMWRPYLGRHGRRNKPWWERRLLTNWRTKPQKPPSAKPPRCQRMPTSSNWPEWRSSAHCCAR